MTDIQGQKILVLDFGSQTTQLIARRVREARVYCEIYPYNIPIDKIEQMGPKGIILSGGPASVYDKDAPTVSPLIFELGIPILGICYGMQLITYLFKGKVERSQRREYGPARLLIDDLDGLFHGLASGPSTHRVWMSHGDKINALPKDFIGMAHSESSPVAAIRHKTLPIFAVQFHPEVVHTEIGRDVLSNFLFQICGCTPSWDMSSFVEKATSDIQARVGSDRIIGAISGGVDSTVTAILVNKAVGHQLTSIFVNNGLLRKGEAETVLAFLKQFHLNVRYVNAGERFLKGLSGVKDPEKKRKIIGESFIRVFEKEARHIGGVKFLAQGTLYPDVIESTSFRGPSARIKSHHNVGGLPEVMQLKLIEPLRELFKDEVRKVGKELGMPEELIFRQPFPGPGLAIRVLGEVTPERLEVLREADAIVLEEMKASGWYRKVWQSFAVLLPIKTVGVMGDERSYDNVVAIRVVDSLDAMTADWTRLPPDLLARLSNRIINEVVGVNRVCYDISSKPPATIEWE
ncbi:MAG: glutamine-hydrolyzing GMP synthase [Nitrospiraceae bacterium]|nr:glutamine-hydrolyzing GMP synthase [Nitrospiraceae bacterium]